MAGTFSHRGMLGFDTVATKSHHHQPVNASTFVLGWKLVTALGIGRQFGGRRHWKPASGVREIRELLGAQIDFRASNAAFAYPKDFTQDARRFARRNAIETIDDSALQRALSFYFLTKDFQKAFNYFSRTYPKCGGALIRRNHGMTKEAFWGCSNYKSHGCEYTEPYDRSILEPRPNFKAG